MEFSRFSVQFLKAIKTNVFFKKTFSDYSCLETPQINGFIDSPDKEFMIFELLSSHLLYSRRTSCEAEVKILGDAVVNYYAETGRIPSAGIDSLKSELTRDDMEVDGRKVGPWLKENMSTVDPWGQEYEYTVEGVKYEICSKGSPTDNEPICYNKFGRKSKD